MFLISANPSQVLCFILAFKMTEADRLQAIDVDFACLVHDIASIEAENPKSELLAVLTGSMELKSYQNSLRHEMRDVEEALLHDILRDSSSIISLYTETQECERILIDMDSTLSGFAESLRGVSDEIRQLQDKSEELSNLLKSRSEVQEKLIAFVDAAVLSPDIVKTIFEEEDCCSDRFVNAVIQLGKRLEANALLDPTLPAMVESASDFQKLKLKAVARIREYIVASLNALRQPKSSNLVVVQKSSLAKASPLVKFLSELDGGEFHAEITGYYSAVASKYYLNFFKAYVQGLSKLPIESAVTKTDVVGALEYSGDQSGHGKGGAFSLSGGRDRVIKEDLNSEPISVSPLESPPGRVYPEMMLRNVHKLLVESATNEFGFLKDFFGPSFFENIFCAVFDKSLAFLSDHVSTSLLRDSYDPVGLILSLRILEFFQDLMINKRKISGLDGYFEALQSQLRGRLKYTLEIQTESIKKLDSKKVNPLPPISSPILVTRKFAEFSASLLFVRSHLNSDDPQLTNQIDSLISAYEAFMSALGKRFASPIEQQVWHLNNLDLIVGVFRERNASSKKFSDKMNMYISVFVEAKLSDHFGPLIKLILDSEQQRSVGANDVERQAIWFQQNWKSEIKKLSSEIVNENLFSNLQTASEILKSVMTQLLLYYTRFQKIVSSSSASASLSRSIVPTAVIMAEIKQGI